MDGEATLRELGQMHGAGVARTELMLDDGRALVEFAEGASRAVRFPRYPGSGHVVSLHAPEELARDVEQFLADALARREQPAPYSPVAAN
jgi:hypothetical protein